MHFTTVIHSFINASQYIVTAIVEIKGLPAIQWGNKLVYLPTAIFMFKTIPDFFE